MSKSSLHFKRVIEAYINELASNDDQFAKRVNRADKNIDDCIIYVLNQVKNSGVCVFEGEEIFGIATHYYDEDDIQVGSPIPVQNR